ncbi:MAG: PfkB family carbohydrate kinase [Synergistaceae bacterium]|jgi:1-phosphofructokinase family hexose kinase|nr:PfkB family carbohydrate kinase [Synergistaceae bacterium]
MILTVTLNPAVDMDFIVRDLQPGERYRAGVDVSRRSPGGAGINISIVLKRLGLPSIATGFLAGFDGSCILDELQKEDIFTNFVHIGGETRINVCIIDIAKNSETRLHERGVEVSAPDRDTFLRTYERVLTRTDMVSIGGSLPPGIDASIYGEMVRMAKNAAIPVMLHPAEEDLEAALEEAPSVVKLNYQRSWLRSSHVQMSVDAFMECARSLHGRGTQWVVMSLDQDKVAFSSPTGAWIAEGPLSEMSYVYATEDALLAGILAGLQERAFPERIMRLAMACYRECATHPEKFPKDRACVEERTPGVLLKEIV